MTVEVKELVIRAIVDQGDGQAQETVGGIGGTGGTGDTTGYTDGNLSANDREALIQECVRQVLRILQKKEER